MVEQWLWKRCLTCLDPLSSRNFEHQQKNVSVEIFVDVSKWLKTESNYGTLLSLPSSDWVVTHLPIFLFIIYIKNAFRKRLKYDYFLQLNKIIKENMFLSMPSLVHKNFHSTVEVNAVHSLVVHKAEHMLYKAVKDIWFKFCLPQIFSNYHPDWFECSLAYFLHLLFDIVHKLVDHHIEKFEINRPDKPSPIDHLNCLIKSKMLEGEQRK